MKGEVGKTGQESNFLDRLIELNRRKYKSQARLAAEVGVARSTVAGWFAGNSVPGSRDLKGLAQAYGVSTDYLLGLSNTESPDVSVKAAVAYTGLSEKAVRWLHIGIDDFECDGEGLSEEEKRLNLRMASKLIQSRSFTKIIYELIDVVKAAYLERILENLEDQHSENAASKEDLYFCFAKQEDRKIVMENLIHVLEIVGVPWEEPIEDVVHAMDDDTLMGRVQDEKLSATERKELRQFHASKALNNYIDQLMKDAYEKADRRFETK